MVKEFDTGAHAHADSSIDSGASERLLLSVSEFCKQTGLSRSKAYLELSEGTLRARKIGRRTVIPIQEARRWIEQLPEYRGTDQAIDREAADQYPRNTGEWRHRGKR